MKNKILKFLFPIPTIVITAVWYILSLISVGFSGSLLLFVAFFLMAMLPLDLIIWIAKKVIDNYKCSKAEIKEIVKIKCPNCGKLLDTDSQFCTACGYSLSKQIENTSEPTAHTPKLESDEEQTEPNENNRLNPDSMNGYEFEHFCAKVLQMNGFSDINITKASGDQGVDIIAIKEGRRYAIQCKRYSSNVGNKAVQEVIAGRQYYNCSIGIVMTNSYFTQSAKELASRTNIILWDRDFLYKYIGNQQNISPELEAKGRKILQDMSNVYTSLFQEKMHVNVVPVNARFRCGDIELIYKCDTNEQVKYLVSQQDFLSEKLHSQQYFTELSNNHMSVIVKE